LALIDSGCTITSVSPRWVERNDIPYQVKEKPTNLYLADGGRPAYGKGQVHLETKKVQVKIGDIEDDRILNIIDTGDLDAIVGYDWLDKHNPDIDWQSKTINGRYPARKNAAGRKATIQCTPNDGRIGRISAHKIARIYAKTPEKVGVIWFRRTQTPGEGPKVPAQIPAQYAKFKELFEETEETALPIHQEWDHEIPIKEGAELKPAKMYPVNREQEREVAAYLEKNLRKGYIRESTSPMASPILFVPKKNGKLRLCVDYRAVNNATVKNVYPLPLIQELMDRLQGARWFTKFDIREGYYRIRVKEGHEWKTAFKTRYGLYEYKVMPFGLTNAPATFQSVINKALHEYLDVFVTAYLDDVLVYSKGTLEEHVEHVKKVLKKLQEYRLLIQPDKSEFHVPRTEFLGFIVSGEGIEMDPSKVQDIRDWPTPKSVKEVQSFLGFANFLRKFIKDYSKHTKPLTELTKKEQIFLWGPEQEEAFQKLKDKFCSGTVLRMFNPELPIRVYTDASDFALGACFFQSDDGKTWRPVAYHSRKLTPAELNYEIHDKELMAIIAAFKEWRPWLTGTRFQVEVFSDHRNLTSFMSTKELNRRQVRWAENMADYNFCIKHCKGTENGAADALSRRIDYQIEGKPTYDALFTERPDGALEYNHPRLSAVTTFRDRWENKIRAHWNTHGEQGFETPEGLLVVPEEMENELILEKHASIAHGHQGIAKTIERITRNYHIKGLRRKVEAVIKDCQPCNQNKPSRHKPYGLLQPLDPPAGPWQSVTMDFIVKLPRSRDPVSGVEYDSILVIVDRSTKQTIFEPTNENITADQLVSIVFRRLISQHGMPQEIITDRGVLFTSELWKTVLARLGSKSKLSTSVHPQTDGQTERMNQSLEQYLRMYVDYGQTNWADLLPMAEFAINSATSDTTRMTPFYANYGYEPTAYHEARTLVRESDKGLSRAEQYRKTNELLLSNIAKRNESSKKFANKNRVKGPTLKEGDKVFLLRKNIQTTRPSGKLDQVKLGAFKIKRVIGPVNYELQLPKGMKIHPIFHVSLLEPAPPNAELAQDITIESDDVDYEVEEIKDLRKFGRQWKYLVKWKEYDDTDNTWEPLKNLKGCPEKVESFHQIPGKPPRPGDRKGKASQRPKENKQRAAVLRAQPAPPLPTSPPPLLKQSHDLATSATTHPPEPIAAQGDDASRAREPCPPQPHPTPSEACGEPRYSSETWIRERPGHNCWSCEKHTRSSDLIEDRPDSAGPGERSWNRELASRDFGRELGRRDDGDAQLNFRLWACRRRGSRGAYDTSNMAGELRAYEHQTPDRNITSDPECSHDICIERRRLRNNRTDHCDQWEDFRRLRLRDEDMEGEADVTSNVLTGATLCRKVLLTSRPRLFKAVKPETAFERQD